MTPEEATLSPNAFRWSRTATNFAARQIWERYENEPGGHIRLKGWTSVRDLDAEAQLLACPVCAAVVFDDGSTDLVWRHEEWHARTDCPIPDELKD